MTRGHEAILQIDHNQSRALRVKLVEGVGLTSPHQHTLEGPIWQNHSMYFSFLYWRVHSRWSPATVAEFLARAKGSSPSVDVSITWSATIGAPSSAVAIDGVRIETAETFAIDWAKVKNDRLFDGDGKRVEQYYGFGEDVLAVADGTVVYIHDGMPDETPSVLMVPKSKSDYGGNNVILEIAPNVFAWYAHLRQGSLTVKVGDAVKAGAPIAKLGNTGPSEGPHLHFGLLNKPDPIAGRSLPFVFDSFTLDGAVDFDTSKGDRLVIRPDARQVRGFSVAYQHHAPPILRSFVVTIAPGSAGGWIRRIMDARFAMQ